MDNVTYLKEQVERKITLNDYVKAYYDCDILPFPPEKNNLVNQIAILAIEYKNKHLNTYKRRINEQGNDQEEHLKNSMNNILNGIFKLLGTGYPDVGGKAEELEFPLYCDSKIRKNLIDKESIRSFYTSTPAKKTKNKKDLKTGYHLLFIFEHDGNGKLTGKYRVSDLNGFIYTSFGNKQEGSYSDILSHNKFIAENL